MSTDPIDLIKAAAWDGHWSHATDPYAATPTPADVHEMDAAEEARYEAGQDERDAEGELDAHLHELADRQREEDRW